MYKKIDIRKINKKFSDGLEFKPDIGRKTDLGEVFTPWPVVNKMLHDLIHKKSFSDDRIIEPACGNGNFSVEIFKTKIKLLINELKAKKVRDKLWTKEYEIGSLLALASMYQNDIDKQNIDELKSRLHSFANICYKKYSHNKKTHIPVHYDIAVTNILESNCFKGNFLSNSKINLIYCYRHKDFIFRVKKKLRDLIDKTRKFNAIQIDEVDKIKYNNWRKTMKRRTENKIEKKVMSEKEAIQRIKKEIMNKFGIKTNQDFKFTYCISNPPYQEHIEGKRSQPIYLNFFKIGTQIADKVSMIFPLAWQKSSGKGHYGNSSIEVQRDRHVVSIDNYYEDTKKNPLILFETASTGGVNIIQWDSNYNNNGQVKFLEYGEYVGKRDMSDYKHLDPVTKSIFKKLERSHKLMLKSSMLAQYGNGVNFKTFRKHYPDLISPIKKTKMYMKAWTRLKSNTFGYYYFFKKIPGLKIKPEYLSKWKVVLIFTGPNTHYRTYKILKPKELWDSDVYLCKLFNSKEEAENFVTYINTDLYKFALTKNTMTYSISQTTFDHVPDMQNTKNPRSGKIGWNSNWLNNDLKKIFKCISDAEWEHINKIATASMKRN